MKILHISDTHGLHDLIRVMPEADVLVHSGDCTDRGTDGEAIEFLQWFCNQPYRHKILVAGNHDICLWDSEVEGLPDNVHLLRNESIAIEGIVFYGLAFTSNAEGIPEGTDVVVSHEPPSGVLDLSGGTHCGSDTLLRTVRHIRPRAHLFGHAHEGYGTLLTSPTLFSNAALLDDSYNLRNAPQTIIID